MRSVGIRSNCSICSSCILCVLYAIYGENLGTSYTNAQRIWSGIYYARGTRCGGGSSYGNLAGFAYTEYRPCWLMDYRRIPTLRLGLIIIKDWLTTFIYIYIDQDYDAPDGTVYTIYYTRACWVHSLVEPSPTHSILPCPGPVPP